VNVHRLDARSDTTLGEVGRVRERADLLLAELHAHSTWSDGRLSLAALVDLYGEQGFDVLCITDHVHPPDDPWAHLGVPAERFGDYIAAIASEAERACDQYGLLVVPGLELTVNHADPDLAAHAVAIGLRSYVSLEEGLERGLVAARDAGAALVAAHPSGPAISEEPAGATRRFWRELEALAGLVDRFELINGHRAYGWVAEAQLPAVAAGDFHWIDHLSGWKTLLPCARDEQMIVACLRSRATLHLAPFSPGAAPARLAA
jgi:3',5'-nucleoside bisphosphate phosphatase